MVFRNRTPSVIPCGKLTNNQAARHSFNGRLQGYPTSLFTRDQFREGFLLFEMLNETW